jgi:hypothetical protein
MPETVANFDTPVQDRFGERYVARACGRRRADGLWEGWIEFERLSGADVLRTQRETTQSELEDLRYWASGLTPVYLEGALDRIVTASSPQRPAPESPPVFDGPAESSSSRHYQAHGNAVLNPFSVYEKSPTILAQELSALRAWHLRQILTEYGLVDQADPRLETLSEPELGSLILQRVRELHP